MTERTRTLVVVLALLVLPLLVLACSPDAEEPAAAPTVAATDPEVTAAVAAAFTEYRVGVVQGDADAVRNNLTEASLESMADLAEMARTLPPDEVEALPAAEQLILLTYRLRPDVLAEDDPYAALVEQGFAGQDRSLGDLGLVTRASDDLALGEVVDPAAQRATPLRWRFALEDGEWKFDLDNAHSLLSQAIQTAAIRQQTDVRTIVIGTIAELSGLDVGRIEAAYTPPE